jgi:hypothetical protein
MSAIGADHQFPDPAISGHWELFSKPATQPGPFSRPAIQSAPLIGATNFAT